jgi:TilS substrate binding domain
MNMRAEPLAVRAVVLVSGVALVLAPAHPHVVGVAATVVGVLLAAALPGGAGAAVATVGFALAWLTSTGLHTVPGAGRTVLAAAALYALHQSSALAAFLPLDAVVDRAVLRHWLARCGPPLGASAVVVTVSELLPRRHGSAAVELAGLIATVVVLAVATRRLWSAGRR